MKSVMGAGGSQVQAGWEGWPYPIITVWGGKVSPERNSHPQQVGLVCSHIVRGGKVGLGRHNHPQLCGRLWTLSREEGVGHSPQSPFLQREGWTRETPTHNCVGSSQAWSQWEGWPCPIIILSVDLRDTITCHSQSSRPRQNWRVGPAAQSHWPQREGGPRET